MEATLRVIRELVEGEMDPTSKARNNLQASRTYDWSVWRNAVDTSHGNICYAGHSFGGTAAVSGDSLPDVEAVLMAARYDFR
jgi:hypothetical protein